MKIKKLLAVMGLGLFAVTSVSAALLASKPAMEAKADGVTGTISVDLTGESWASNTDGQNISVYFWDDDSHTGWGSYSFAAHEQYVVFVDYDLTFTPTKMKAVRYSNWYAKSDWEADPWCLQTEPDHTWGKWNESDDLDFSANGNIVIAGSGYCFVGFAYIHGKSAGTSWEWTTLAQLSNVKLNGSNHIEYYISKEFTQWEEFGIKLFSDTWVAYSATSFSDFVDTSEWNNSSGNLQYTGSTAKSFALYFDRNAGTIYINDANYAAADDWSDSFLKGVGCDPTGVALPTNWSTFATSYADLDGDVKDIIYAAEANEDGTLTEHAVATYDYAVAHHSTLEKFIKDHSDNVRLVEHNGYSILGIEGITSNSNIMLIAIVSIIAVASISAVMIFVVAKRRKHN